MIDLARKVDGEMVWRVELDNVETCHDLLKNVKGFEQVNRKEKAAKMKYAFQWNGGSSAGRPSLHIQGSLMTKGWQTDSRLTMR